MGDDSTMAATTDHYWKQFYQQSLMDGSPALAPVPAPPAEGFAGGTVVTATSPATMSSAEVVVLSPSRSYTDSTATTAGQLTPKGNIVFKPIRRRSRASKRTPTTLLNANTTNFRALVQQFTGCPRTAMSFGGHKGPITLDFQQGRQQQQQTLHHNTVRMMAPFGNNKGYHRVEKVPQQQNDFPRAKNMEISEGLLLDNDFGLHELTGNDFSVDI